MSVKNLINPQYSFCAFCRIPPPISQDSLVFAIQANLDKRWLIKLSHPLFK